LKLLIKSSDNDGRLALVPEFLSTPWNIEVVDFAECAGLSRTLASADAVVSMDWSRDMPPAPRLRLLQLPGAGTDDIDFDAVPAQAYVCNVYEHEIGIAEYVLAAMLQWTMRLPVLDAALRRGDWWGSHLCGPAHGELHGQTLGILGYGRIGQETARRARAFGMQVRACSRTARAGDGLVGEVQGLESLDSLLAESDFILVSLPLNQTTQGLIDKTRFGRMKPHAVLINVARGAIVDEAALFEACRERRIGGAVIDTWYRYPQPQAPQGAPAGHPFHELDNVIMTPHASAWTEGLRPRRNRAIALNLDRIAHGESPENLVRAPKPANN
jgi:phosphoglycerate dehydrogenase-like enzyme